MPENASQSKSSRIVAGCMTGTSLDGLDVALVRIDGHGLQMKPTLIGHHAVSMPGDLRQSLMHLASGNAAEPIVCLRAARQLGLFHAEGLGELFAKHPDAKPDFITAHGQTIWHAPTADADLGPMSWQLFDPWPIVQRHGVPVCYDLRQADLIAGGEGAPLTPIADWVMYKDYFGWVVNLGGVLNMTRVERDSVSDVRALDVYPCNLFLDGISTRLLNQRYDADGATALRGRVIPGIVALMQRAVDEARGAGSLGREQFSETWLNSLFERLPADAKAEDILRSGCETVAIALSRVVSAGPEAQKAWVVLAGGGARNNALIEALNGVLDTKPYLTDEFAIPCEAREAMGWAVLGALSQDGVPVSLPRVTGATDPGVAGVWAGV